jgi:hypothetical protein
MVHTAIVLPQDLLERVKRDAEEHDLGLSATIRQHLQLIYLLEGPRDDPETRDLLAAIKHLAQFVERDVGKKWHEHAYALAAFKAGVGAFLARYHPQGNETVRPDTAAAGRPDDPPDVVGRTHARRIAIANHEDEDEVE